ATLVNRALFCPAQPYLVAVKGALPGHVGQGVRSGPVDVAAAGELAPAPLGGDHDARPDCFGENGLQLAPAAAVFHDRRIPVAYAAPPGILRMDLYHRRPFPLE